VPRRVASASPQRWIPALVSALAAFLLYAPSTRYGFVWDDHSLIENNTYLRGWSALLTQLHSDFWLTLGTNASGYWRPLVSLSYAVDGALWHWAPAAFRYVNIAAHAGVGALVALLVVQSGAPAWAALVAGLLFASMPAHVESVAWISGRTDLFCALFFLLALWLDRRARRAGRAWPGVLPLVALALALLSKEGAAVFVIVAALADVLERRVTLVTRLKWLASYVAVTLVYVALHRLWVGSIPVTPVSDAAALTFKPAGVAMMFPAYLAFLWPWYPHTPAVTLQLAQLTPLRVALAVAIQAAFVAGVVLLCVRRTRAALGLSLFWITLLPTLAVNLGAGVLYFSERFAYLPTAGIAWAAGVALAATPRGSALRVASLAAAGVLTLGSVGMVLGMLPAWRSDATIFESMTRIAPENYMAHTQWARSLAGEGREAEALRQLDLADHLDSRRPDAPSVRAFIHYGRGEWAPALALADEAIRRGSGAMEPRLIRSVSLLSLGRLDEARVAIEEMRRRAPGNINIGTLWAQYLLASGRATEALSFLERSAATYPGDVNLHYTLGLTQLRVGHVAPARDAFARTVSLDPAHYDALLQLAMIDAQLDDFENALIEATRAAALPQARDGRAATLLATLHRVAR
jgi:protein O-mannosyl-transferase